MTTVAPVNQRGSASATFVAEFDDEAPVAPGCWHFYVRSGRDDPAGILFGCPCGCGSLFSVGFDTHESSRPRWAWNGKREGISLSPSILIHQMNDAGEIVGEHWHGFLTDGSFNSC